MFGLTTKTRAALEHTRALLAASDSNNAELRAQVEYWRVRAERLMDAALARRGEIHEPTMREPKPPAGQSPMELIASAMAVTEVTSGKKGFVDAAVHG